MPRVVHFEIHADDPSRAVLFYSTVFGWEITKLGPQEYWLIITGKSPEPGIDGAIMKRQNPVEGNSVNAYVCTIDVPSVDEYMEKVNRAGGSMIQNKVDIPKVGLLIYCKDTEGNIFGMVESSKSQK